ncbi:MAG: hypothetical protein CME62_03445 [Halobacteriovoraceae bacterium]|nr:hypothetical protein [Halobacteriovoraceae bacterium]|tara:strand:+ start:39525 stop:41294 length:1770 start_codon:yes stop_codon:yes gene_type:complete
MKSRSCVISLIGRPNVGKSSIYNRLMRKSFKVMTYDQPGVTRDRHYSIANFTDARGENPTDVILIDTGGFYPEKIEPEKKEGKKKTAEPFFNIMADQAKLAIDESDLVLMVVDVREGLIPFDQTICDYIRTTKKPMWLLVNKFDSDKQWGDEGEFYSLGLKEDDFFIVSAEHGRGLEILRESIHNYATQFNESGEGIQKGVTPNHDVVANVAIVGAPNAGKSTLLNQFLGAHRALVSNVAGTTVDPIEGYFDLRFGQGASELEALEDQFRKSNQELLAEFKEHSKEIEKAEMLAYDELPEEYKSSEEDFDDESEMEFLDEHDEEAELSKISDDMDRDDTTLGEREDESEQASEEIEENPYRSIKLVDTAGIRKQKVVTGFIEEQSVFRSLKSISEADVVIYVVDSTKGITHQDRRLCDITLEKGKSLIICMNKIDLINDKINDPKKKREWLMDLRDSVPWLGFCEIITISALKGKYLNTLKNSLKHTILIRNQRITTGKLNKTISALVERNPVTLDKSRGVKFKVKYASMLKSTPPTFLLFTNKSKGIPQNYRKYLMNGLRREFQMVNTPVHLIFRTTTDIERRLKRTK